MNLALLALLTIGGPGFLLVLLGIIYKIVLAANNKKCTATAIGKVIDYYYKGEMRVGPIVEFIADGQTYTMKRVFEGYKSIVRYPAGGSNLWEDEKGYLHTKRGMIGDWQKCAEELWPMGSEMTVHYNPSKPSKGYVEKPTKGNFITGFFVLAGVGIMIVSVIMSFVVQ